MSDFFQTGAIATLHRLGKKNTERVCEHLEEFSLEMPMALVLPCHIRELTTPALSRIVRELKNVTYIKQIVVGIDGASRAAAWRQAAPGVQSVRTVAATAHALVERRSAHAGTVRKTGGSGTQPRPRGQGAQCVDLSRLRPGQRSGAHGGPARLRHCHL